MSRRLCVGMLCQVMPMECTIKYKSYHKLVLCVIHVIVCTHKSDSAQGVWGSVHRLLYIWGIEHHTPHTSGSLMQLNYCLLFLWSPSQRMQTINPQVLGQAYRHLYAWNDYENSIIRGDSAFRQKYASFRYIIPDSWKSYGLDLTPASSYLC